MILRPEYYYSFFRTDPIRYEQERKDLSNEYPYLGEILSDSWGRKGAEPKDCLLWDEDSNSGDYWKYEDIYPELLDFVNKSIKDGFHMSICESGEDCKDKPNDYLIADNKETVIKLNDIQLSHFTKEDVDLVMGSPYSQYFVYQPTRPILTEESIKKLKGKPCFGDEIWKIGDMHLYCMIEEPSQVEINLIMVQLGSSNINDIESEYSYVRMCGQIPVFKRK